MSKKSPKQLNEGDIVYTDFRGVCRVRGTKMTFREEWGEERLCYILEYILTDNIAGCYEGNITTHTVWTRNRLTYLGKNLTNEEAKQLYKIVML